MRASAQALLLCLAGLLLADPLPAQGSPVEPTEEPVDEDSGANADERGEQEDDEESGAPSEAPPAAPSAEPAPPPRAPTAKPNPALGRKLFTAGAAAFKRGDYLTALQALEAAYRADPRPGILFSIGQAHRRQFVIEHEEQHLRGAIERYRRYIELDPGGSRRGEATEALVELESQLPRERAEEPLPVAEPKTQLLIVSVEGATASLDGGPDKPVPFVAQVEPGAHRIHASAPGYVARERDAQAVEGITVMVDLPLRELPARVALESGGGELWIDERFVAGLPLTKPLELPPGRHFLVVRQRGHVPYGRVVELERGHEEKLQIDLSPTGQRVAAVATLGVGVAAMLTGGALAVVSVVEEGHAQDILDAAGSRNLDQSELDDYRATIERRDTEKTAAIALMGGGLGVSLVAAALLIFDDPAPPPAPPSTAPDPKPTDDLTDVAWQPFVGPSAVGASVSARF